MWKWDKINENLQQDMKLILFILAVTCLFRIGFIAVLYPYMGEATTSDDVWVALFYGFRMSLKSAGLMGVASFGICFLIQALSLGQGRRARLVVGAIYIGLLSMLFYARIPYYEQFHMGFNQLLFNALQDDLYALFFTLIEQYHLPLRFCLAAATAYGLFRLMKAWLGLGVLRLPSFPRWYQNVPLRAAFLLAIYFAGIFLRFGGSMTYAHNIDWENSGVTRDQLLNEAILDDMQALYRAYELHERLRTSTGLDINPAQIHEYGARVAGQDGRRASVADYLQKTAQGSRAEKPGHIFLIVGESYANWTLLPEYRDLNIANGLKGIIRQPEAAYVPAFLPNGMSTISGVLGIVTGLTDVNLYLNYNQETYQGPFPTAIAPQLKKLGYRTRFWYAGPNSWERIEEFTRAQGFDDFYGRGDFESRAGNVWGADDKYLFNAVLSGISPDIPSFNIILTVSNHSPYTVDLQQEGFDRAKVVAGLPAKLRGDEELIRQLGHFWYADKVMAEFVATVRQKYPDSLFIIVGDHADRLNLEANPGLYKRYGIPFVAYGQGVAKDSFPQWAAGSHIDVGPTLLELVAPQGFAYYSLGRSLTRGNGFGMNYGFWITRDYIGSADSAAAEFIEGGNPALRPDRVRIEKDIEALRAVSWWLAKRKSE
ncbi:MAG TPA: sulfatase-like hydrolase/transferase [Selenomonadales bacterium]|nr:sulfatase-like hydrolase/transferase [Selenomonadales bacterium]